MQEVYYNTGKGDRFGLNAWFLTSKRGLSQTTVDYRDPKDINATSSANAPAQRTLVGHLRPTYKVGAKAGYIHTWLGYDYARDKGNGEWAYMITSRSKVNTLFASGNSEFYVGKNGFSRPTLPCTMHFAKNQDRNIITQQGDKAVVGYDKARTELSAYMTAKWTPTERLGLSLALREDMYGKDWTPLIPAFYADYMLSKAGNVRAKASISRNYPFPHAQ